MDLIFLFFLFALIAVAPFIVNAEALAKVDENFVKKKLRWIFLFYIAVLTFFIASYSISSLTDLRITIMLILSLVLLALIASVRYLIIKKQSGDIEDEPSFNKKFSTVVFVTKIFLLIFLLFLIFVSVFGFISYLLQHNKLQLDFIPELSAFIMIFTFSTTLFITFFIIILKNFRNPTQTSSTLHNQQSPSKPSTVSDLSIIGVGVFLILLSISSILMGFYGIYYTLKSNEWTLSSILHVIPAIMLFIIGIWMFRWAFKIIFNL
jgi:hypothetical protein